MAPVRTCIGCRTSRRATDLVRYVRTDDGGLEQSRSAPGRGAWVCPDDACIALAMRRNAFARALRADIRRDALDTPATSG